MVATEMGDRSQSWAIFIFMNHNPEAADCDSYLEVQIPNPSLEIRIRKFESLGIRLFCRCFLVTATVWFCQLELGTKQAARKRAHAVVRPSERTSEDWVRLTIRNPNANVAKTRRGCAAGLSCSRWCARRAISCEFLISSNPCSRRSQRFLDESRTESLFEVHATNARL